MARDAGAINVVEVTEHGLSAVVVNDTCHLP
jgi:hypothetical protein